MSTQSSALSPTAPAKNNGLDDGAVSPEIRAGNVFWLFGLSGAGKSTLAADLKRSLAAEGYPSLLLDGDRLRGGLCQGLGFGVEDRTENLRRAAEVARLGVESGLVVIAAFITPLELQRRAVEKLIGPERISWIHTDAALAVCQQRDVKGLYAQAAVGTVIQMTGVGSAFEQPGHCDCVLPTGSEPVQASAERLREFALNVLRGGSRSGG